MNTHRSTRFWPLIAFFLSLFFSSPSQALPNRFGDLDEDGQPTVVDLVRLIQHVDGTAPLPDSLARFADLTGDGAAGQEDVDQLVEAILGRAELPQVASTQMTSSPLRGEGGVAITRETILRFSAPLSADATLDDQTIYAEFGGNRLPARLHVGSERKTVTLFYNDLLPASARVRVTVKGDALLDVAGLPVDADGDGRPGGTGFIDFDTLSLTVLEGTAVCGRVFASELTQTPQGNGPVNQPLAGVRITVDGREDEWFAITDEFGNFRLEPAPVGRFFVHIDGRTANVDLPEGAYYPFVGKAWQSTAGTEVNVGEIYLPLIEEGTLQSVSQTEATEIRMAPTVLDTFPEFSDVKVTVPANSLFSNDGSRGGQVGIAPVPPDRLPGQLPPGLKFPVVITVQTDGPSNFDEPVPVCFPNLPDPVTGEKLPPGAKSALWSFNHDTGEFEIVGPMTVNEDGTLVCSDPGVGILAPGWHGSNNGTPGSGPKGPEKDPCEGLSTSQIIDNIVDLGVAAGKCLGELSGVSETLKKVLALAADIRSLVNNARSLLDQIDKGANVGVARDSFKVIGDAKSTIQNGIELVQRNSPVGKVTAAMKCAESILAALDNICGRSVKNDSDCNSIFIRLTCVGIGVGKTIIAQINKVADAVDDGLKKLGLALVCATIDKIATLLDIGTRTENQVRQGIAALNDDDPVPQEVIDELRLLVAQAKTLEEEWQPIEQFAADSLAFEETVEEIQSDIPKVIFEQVGSPANAYYLIELPNLELRGRTSAQGQLQEILPPETDYTLSIYDPITGWLGSVSDTTAPNGFPTDFPVLDFKTPEQTADADLDGLLDVVEHVVGTNPNDPDSDDDGILDSAEVLQGTDPLEGTPARTGVIGSVDTPGTALDVAAFNDLVGVADGEAGVALFNVFNGMRPLIISQVDTPGFATAVAIGENRIAVADGSAGLALIDITDPPAATVFRQLSIGHAQAVAVDGLVAFVGLRSGELVAVELSSGSILDTFSLSGLPIQDIRVAGDHTYALVEGTLFVLSFNSGAFRLHGSVATPGGINTDNGRMRLFVGGGIAYVTHRRGYNTIDVGTPNQPSLIAEITNPQFGWKQIVANGSGLGIAAVSPNQAFDGPHHVSLYDVSDPLVLDAFLTEFTTPGVARSVALYNGIAYAADHTAGLQVINYLPYDTQGTAPTLSLLTSANNNNVEEGKSVRLTANAADDQQVRNVEFYVDGRRIATDGNFPFEVRFLAPTLSEQPSVTVQARASDTGGNAIWTDPLVLPLTPDATPPQPTRQIPGPDGSTGIFNSVRVYWNETIAESSLTTETFFVLEPGPDGLFGTDDDVVLPNGIVTFDSNLNVATLNFPSDFGTGVYQAVVLGSVTDLAGNAIGSDIRWVFSSGMGVTGEYYSGINFDELLLTRVDPTINYDWDTGVPAASLPADFFSVRWRGGVTPRYTETYTFYTVSDDGVRLWINDELIIDNWTVHAATENASTPVELEAGVTYEIRMDFFENQIYAVAQLFWESASQPKEIIPASQLLPWDFLAPTLLSAQSINRPNHVAVRFNKPVDAETGANPENYAIDQGVEVLGARLGINPAYVLLTTSDIPQDGTPLTLTVNQVRSGDMADPIAPDSQVPLVTGHQTISRRVYTNIPGIALNDLISAPKFPYQPDVQDYRNEFETPVDVMEDYGVWFAGYFIPDESGAHIFYLSSDDNSRLYLSTDESPANAQLIAEESSWSGSRVWNRPSEPIELQAGERYYIEAMMKEGRINDNLAVAVQKPSGTPPANGDAPIPGTMLAPYFDSGTPTIGAHPSSVTADEFGDATFSIDELNGTPPLSIQWFKNGEPIPGANEATLTLQNISAVDDQAAFHATVSNPVDTMESQNAVLTVEPDLDSPSVVSAKAGGDFQSITITFDEPVDRASATDLNSYIVEGLTVLSATVSPDGTEVTLGSSSQEPAAFYDLTVRNVRDRAAAANTLVETTWQFRSWIFVKGLISRRVYASDGNLDATYPAPRGQRNVPDDTMDDGYGRQVMQFETPPNIADNYVAVLSGWLCPPEDGNYTFYLSSDDQSELYLSSDDSPANSTLIANEPSWRSPRNWILEGRDTTISEPITLQAGQIYYMEAVMIEFGGGDNLGVAWQRPGEDPPANGSAPISAVFFGTYVAPEDYKPETFISAEAINTTDTVTITFPRPVTEASATNPDHYTMNHGVTVNSATLGTEPNLVVLNVTNWPADPVDLTLTIRNIEYAGLGGIAASIAESTIPILTEEEPSVGSN